jgi:hypothetical protein
VKRIPSLDGLRAISISLVLAGHLTKAGPVPKFMANYAGTGVRIFFVISGYLITTILLNEHSQTSTINLRQFYIRRAYRILPAAAVFMLFAMLMYWHELRWYDIGAMLLYLANFDGARPWMVMHLWSLCVEEQFYFAWPGILRKWYRHRVAILWGVIVLAPLYSAGCYYFKVQSGGYGTFSAVADNLAIGLPAGDIRFAHPTNPALGGDSHAAGGSSHSELSRECSDPHAIYAVCAVADLALLDCRTGVARHPVAVSYLEPCSPRVAGENQLQPVPVAGTLFFQSHSAASVQTSSRHRAGLSFLLSGRAACTQIAGLQSNCSYKPGVRGGTSYVRSPAVTARCQLPLS